MALNVPSYDADDISFGPAVVYIGPAGTTPTADFGAIADDGVNLSFSTESKQIMQGNPKVPILSFIQQQGIEIKLTSIEWNFDRFVYALGAGQTTGTSATQEVYTFGGAPCPTEAALHIVHQMCRTGNTLNVYVRRAQGAGTMEIPFSNDEHAFQYAFTALAAQTDWAGNALGSEEQLIKFVREL